MHKNLDKGQACFCLKDINGNDIGVMDMKKLQGARSLRRDLQWVCAQPDTVVKKQLWWQVDGRT